jgi:hypothetical protein
MFSCHEEEMDNYLNIIIDKATVESINDNLKPVNHKVRGYFYNFSLATSTSLGKSCIPCPQHKF